MKEKRRYLVRLSVELSFTTYELDEGARARAKGRIKTILREGLVNNDLRFGIKGIQARDAVLGRINS